jgi:hypothetical protein
LSILGDVPQRNGLRRMDGQVREGDVGLGLWSDDLRSATDQGEQPVSWERRQEATSSRSWSSPGGAAQSSRGRCPLLCPCRRLVRRAVVERILPVVGWCARRLGAAGLLPGRVWA